MKNRMLTAGGLSMVVAASMMAGAAFNGAEAQRRGKDAPVILTVDMQQVMSQSRAGQSIPSQAEEVRANVAKELESEASALNKEIESFQKNAELMSEDVRQKKGQELQIRSQRILPQRAQIAEQAFRIAVQNAQAKILQESQPILKDIVDDRKATVLLDKSAVLYAAEETEITEEVIKELDKDLKSVEVQKVSLAEIEKQFREAQAKAAAAQGNK